MDGIFSDELYFRITELIKKNSGVNFLSSITDQVKFTTHKESKTLSNFSIGNNNINNIE